MFRAFWVGIMCVAVPPVGMGLAVWLMLRDAGEVPPERREAHRGTDIASTRGKAIVEPRRDWSKIGAYQDGL